MRRNPLRRRLLLPADNGVVSVTSTSRFHPTTFLMRSTIDALKELFGSRGVSAYLVGGYLRDALLGSSSKDLDVAVNGDALSLGRELADLLCGSFVTLDQQRRIARVVLPNDKALVDISSMEGSIEEDLARRDFTVDAMALSLDEADTLDWAEAIVDPFGGRSDLAQGLIRMVSPGVFTEDPARLLRAVRLASSMGFSIEKNTASTIGSSSDLLLQVSAERVRDEFLALLSLKGAKENLHCLDDLGLLCHIIPELETTRGVEQPKEHYWDVFEHTIQAVGAAEKVTADLDKDPLTATLHWGQDMESYFNQVVSDGHNRRTLLKLGALFHDIAKPQTKATDSKGRTRFLGHTELGASMAGERLRALRLSARGVKGVCTMVEHHLRPTQMSQGLEPPTNRAIYRFYRDLDETANSVLYLSLADYLAARGPMVETEDWQRRVDLVNYVLAEANRERSPERKERLVTGHDLIETFGLEPGPLFRRLLEGLEEAQAVGDIQTREEALAWVKAKLEEGGV